jgi:hypothetical protein
MSRLTLAASLLTGNRTLLPTRACLCPTPGVSLSRKVSSKHWWKFLWFFIVLGLIELIGVVMCAAGRKREKVERCASNHD